ncbi:DUF6894 family protein [Methylobacterium haplocladii]|uniref:DUF6894 domain-containing protein n=1 Tax=Methylobacterium haplocladii TaxID=1176176 RepID=A0A512IW26_9HYPH|nr:hypothetical protein [Methylobacterium haplocladii]GEP01934.1 hypothetical protein MHA02_43210 [Methylobacterium haplocladii]GJD86396.1 hypothetical protein HPGCJGGD_4302 [Methylobacterium haplocladii]GLS61374.1 hypothetical protein GCM10007887_40820 [Methylobacterium haplocladii]
MPRYYFEIFDNGEGYPDEEGSEFEHDRQAGDEAVGTLAHIAKDKLPDGDHREFVAEVLDETGKLVFHGTLTFRGTWLR